jgi:hypothetical protein
VREKISAKDSPPAGVYRIKAPPALPPHKPMKSPASSLRFAALLVLGGLAIVSVPVFGQHHESAATPTSPDAEPVFDLDFPGGTPAELVTAIGKASGKTLNAIIAPEYATRRLPPIKASGITAASLFRTLANVERGPAIVGDGAATWQNRASFITEDGAPDARSIWYFATSGEPPRQPARTNFYSLAPYLRDGVTVDDITTAIRTAWEMRGDSPAPTIKFHQETQILIAVGHPEQLEAIDGVLGALSNTIAVRKAAAHGASAH